MVVAVVVVLAAAPVFVAARRYLRHRRGCAHSFGGDGGGYRRCAMFDCDHRDGAVAAGWRNLPDSRGRTIPSGPGVVPPRDAHARTSTPASPKSVSRTTVYRPPTTIVELWTSLPHHHLQRHRWLHRNVFCTDLYDHPNVGVVDDDDNDVIQIQWHIPIQ